MSNTERKAVKRKRTILKYYLEMIKENYSKYPITSLILNDGRAKTLYFIIWSHTRSNCLVDSFEYAVTISSIAKITIKSDLTSNYA